MPHVRKFADDPIGRSPSTLLDRAFARVTQQMNALEDELIELADDLPAMVGAQRAHHLYDTYEECRRAMDQYRRAVMLCGPLVPWNRMPPHVAGAAKEMIDHIVDRQPVKARLTSRR